MISKARGAVRGYCAVIALILGSGFVSVGWGQEKPRFEVASIKPMVAGANEVTCRAGTQADGARFRHPCITLSALIGWAWDVKKDGMIDGGPSWVRSFDSRYAIEAKPSGPVSLAEMRLMMQALLAERFRVKVHVESLLRPIFALSVKDKGKMHEVEPGEGMRGHVRFTMEGSAKVLIGEKARMEEVVLWMRSMVPERPIVDATGLTGAYDFRLKWTPDADVESIAFSSAIQDQLGLRLEDRKAPMEVLVIDRAEKPSANE